MYSIYNFVPGFRDDVNQRWQNLKSSLPVSEDDQVVVDEVLAEGESLTNLILKKFELLLKRKNDKLI